MSQDQPQAFPSRVLFFAPLLVLAIGGLLSLIYRYLPQLNPHNLLGAVVGLLFWLVFAGALITEVVALIYGTMVLRSQPIQRNARNVGALGFGFAAIVIGLMWAVSD